MSGRGFARSVGLSHTFIQLAESGDRAVGRRAALQIADEWGELMDASGITVEDLQRGGEISAA